MRMTLLAPEIVEAVLASHQPHGLTMAKAMQPFPVEWAMQPFPVEWAIQRSSWLTTSRP